MLAMQAGEDEEIIHDNADNLLLDDSSVRTELGIVNDDANDILLDNPSATTELVTALTPITCMPVIVPVANVTESLASRPSSPQPESHYRPADGTNGNSRTYGFGLPD